MVTSGPEEHDERFKVDTSSTGHFAWLRTRLALERTMMAWVRTAVALIGFGFTIVQFFERLNSLEGVAQVDRPFAARYVGLVLIASGVLVLLVSARQYRAVMRYLWHGPFAAIAWEGKGPPLPPVYLVTLVMIFVGLFAFVVVVVRAV